MVNPILQVLLPTRLNWPFGPPNACITGSHNTPSPLLNGLQCENDVFVPGFYIFFCCWRKSEALVFIVQRSILSRANPLKIKALLPRMGSANEP